MKIQLNTDDQIHGTEVLRAHVSATVKHALARFGEQVTRVEVHLSDANGGKSGQRDQRCMLEARVKGRQPAVVTELASTLEQAVLGAAEKLTHLLDSTLERLHDHRKGTVEASEVPPQGTEWVRNRVLALSEWENEGEVELALDTAPQRDTEVDQLRMRVIALENLVIVLLADATEKQRTLAPDMADFISPRPGCTPHPLTLRAAEAMRSLLDRADRFRRAPRRQG